MHACPELLKVLGISHQEANLRDVVSTPEHYYDRFVPASLPKKRLLAVSTTELKHLVAGTLVVIAVGLSLSLQGSQTSRYWLDALIGSALVFTSAFILHEIAHKWTAQHYGLWAEFRLTLLGAMLTLLSVVSPLKIISPGVVQMAGVPDRKIIGKVSIAGPLINIVFSATFLLLSPFIAGSLMLAGSFLNSWTAIFNLIPFSILDGRKVFQWNRKVWTASFAASVALALLVIVI